MEEKDAASRPANRHHRPGGRGRPVSPRHLPQDLVHDQLGRLALFSLIGMACWTCGLLIDQLVIVTDPAFFEVAGGKARAIEVVGIIVSALMFMYVRYAATHTGDQNGCQPHLPDPQRRSRSPR